MFKIKWSESSTKRNAIWVIAFLVGIPMAYLGKDISQLLLLAGGVVGAMGVAMPDKPHDPTQE